MAIYYFENCSIHYEDIGEGVPILFMHGLGANLEQVMGLLQLKNTRLITFDFPGHGQTEFSPEKVSTNFLSFKSFARLANALLNHLNISQLIVGGISMGAGVAMSLAMMEPKKVRGLLLVRPAWLWEPARPHLDIIAELGKQCVSTGVGAQKCQRDIESNPAYLKIKRDIPEAASSILQAIQQMPTDQSGLVWEKIVDDQPCSRFSDLGRLQSPALVFGNNADPLHPPQLARALAVALPHGKYQQIAPRYIAGKQHLSELNSHISMFVDEISPSLSNNLNGAPA